MTEKKTYKKPVMEVEEFEETDVIATSGLQMTLQRNSKRKAQTTMISPWDNI